MRAKLSCSACVALAVALAGSLAAGPARAAADLIMNGNFEQTTMTSPQEMNSGNVSGWTTSGYNFIFFSGTADTTGSYTPQYNQNLTLWGPHNGGAAGNTMPASSPTGGNFVGADANYEVGAISQTVAGLTAGAQYVLGFWWAAAQQAGFTGTTQEQWGVTFGNQTQSTALVTTPSQGFVPWTHASMTFTASAATQVLSFLAASPSGGQPPFSLLDGVTLVAAPEPATWCLVVAGLFGSALAARRRRPVRQAAR